MPENAGLMGFPVSKACLRYSIIIIQHLNENVYIFIIIFQIILLLPIEGKCAVQRQAAAPPDGM